MFASSPLLFFLQNVALRKRAAFPLHFAATTRLFGVSSARDIHYSFTFIGLTEVKEMALSLQNSVLKALMKASCSYPKAPAYIRKHGIKPESATDPLSLFNRP